MSSFQLRKKDTDRLNGAALNFFWGFKDEKKRIHLLGKRKVSKPVKEGSLGFKDLNLVNKALLAKQFWRVVEKPESIVSKWVSHKYLSQDSNLQIRRSTLQSLVWKGVVANADIITRDLRWKMGNGRKINIASKFWPWQWNGPRGICNASDLLNVKGDAWDPVKVRSFYTQLQATGVLSGFIPVSNMEDKLVWSRSKSYCHLFCPLCGDHEETIDHVFRTCALPKAIWFGIPLSLRMDDINAHNILSWLLRNCAGWLEKGEDGLNFICWIFTALDTVGISYAEL